MTIELTTEEKVTKLLSSNEILKFSSSMRLVTAPISNLGDFLLNNQEELPVSKYCFIKL